MPLHFKDFRCKQTFGQQAGWSYSAKWLMAGRTLGMHPICAEISGGNTFLSERLAIRTYSLQLSKKAAPERHGMEQKQRQIKMQFPISHIAAILVV